MFRLEWGVRIRFRDAWGLVMEVEFENVPYMNGFMN